VVKWLCVACDVLQVTIDPECGQVVMFGGVLGNSVMFANECYVTVLFWRENVSVTVTVFLRHYTVTVLHQFYYTLCTVTASVLW